VFVGLECNSVCVEMGGPCREDDGEEEKMKMVNHKWTLMNTYGTGNGEGKRREEKRF